MSSRHFVSAALALIGLAIVEGCGDALVDEYLNRDDWAELVVLISSTQPSLVPGQQGTVLARVPNVGKSPAPEVVLQFPPPIGFQYDRVTCASSGTVICPPVSLQQLAGGVIVSTFPPRSELAFTFEGVVTGDVGTQIAITGSAKSDYPYWDKDLSNNSALLYIPIVAPAE
ncbi:MAG TPA: hypothetical protein PLE54_03235 [Burkholderiaceae bacterium]|nr:hypothetical protein [Burkholderiaceae bacterium]HQR69591.1 hypothetical protein [Burkholderiaceae bacterium]